MALLSVPGGLTLAYDVEGEGDPVVLIHGFASSRATNWRAPGWYATLTGAGKSVIALDVRGHGESAKPHHPSAYDEGELAADIVRLLDSLSLPSADIMGYSMGGYIALRLLHDAPHRVRRAVIAGVGENYYGRGAVETDAIAAALRAPSAAQAGSGVPRRFRLFAEQGGNDLEALALCMTRDRRSFGRAEFASLKVPVLIVVGGNDDITGPPHALAEALPGSRVVVVPGRDHMTTVGDKVFKASVLEFLNG